MALNAMPNKSLNPTAKALSYSFLPQAPGERKPALRMRASSVWLAGVLFLSVAALSLRLIS